MECSKLLSVVFFICFSIPMMASCLTLRVNLTRRSGGEISFTERLRGAVDRSRNRRNMIEAVVKQQVARQLAVERPIHWGNGEFVISVAVGTPSVSFDAIIDTGSDLIWTQCLPCQNCFSQSTPIFDPSKSSTYSAVPCTNSLCTKLYSSNTGCNPDCSYDYRYGDGSKTIGDLAYESFSIGTGSDRTFPGITFGCGHDNEGQGFSSGQVGGLVGLGRGPLSLISQLGPKVDNKFSYCLLSFNDSSSQTGPLIFGEGASFSRAKTITLVKNSVIPNFWYIPLTGITLNGQAIDIPAGTFDLQSNGDGGMIIDSGTTVTYLTQAAYSPLVDAIKADIDLTPADGSSVGLDLCYQTSDKLTLPSLTFNFKGGVDYELPAENFFIRASESLLCLAMLSASENLSIFGNIQQQNFHILFDNDQNTLSFMPAKCDSLSSPSSASAISSSRVIAVFIQLRIQ